MSQEKLNDYIVDPYVGDRGTDGDPEVAGDVGDDSGDPERTQYLAESKALIEHLSNEDPDFLIRCLSSEIRVKIYLMIKQASYRAYGRDYYNRNKKKLSKQKLDNYHKTTDVQVRIEEGRKGVGRPRKDENGVLD
jgi:hypothetical protein